MAENFTIEWAILEHPFEPKSKDWTWIVGIIGLGVALASAILGNLIFALFLGLATVALIIHGRKDADLLEIGISKKGVRINREFFPYQTLKSFWVHEEENFPTTLSILSRERFFFPHITVPVPEELDPDKLRDVLLDFLDEAYPPPSTIEALAHFLGLH